MNCFSAENNRFKSWTKTCTCRSSSARVAAQTTRERAGRSSEIMLRRSTSSGSNNEEKKDEKVNTSNLVAAGHDNFDMIFMMLMGIRTATG